MSERDEILSAPELKTPEPSAPGPRTPEPDDFDIELPEAPAGVERRAFLMRSGLVGAVAVLNGSLPASADTAPPPAPPPLSPNLDVVKKSKGPVMTTLEEFYKVGPGPSSSHTIGPMRITYDFYQRCTKLPADQLAKATALKVHLFGSLSATGKGHGTERAALAGIIGKEPATIDPVFLDELRRQARPDLPGEARQHEVQRLARRTSSTTRPKGDFPHPNTMTCKLMAGDKVLLEQEYYSVGGGFIEWKGYTPPKKGQPKYPYATMKELLAHAQEEQADVRAGGDGERGRGLRQERGGDQRLPRQDRDGDGEHRQVRAGRARRSTLPGPIKLKTKAGEVYKRALDDKYEEQRGVGIVAAYALAGSEENARGHLVVTAPTGGSAGVIPALVYALGEGGRKLPQEKIREGLLAGGRRRLPVQAQRDAGRRRRRLPGGDRRRVRHGRGAHRPGARLRHQVVANAAESALEHHLGMTCDPVAGFVQVPCIERCAYGAVKAWTGFMIASNEIPANRRVDFDTTVAAMALTAKEMNSKYKETSEGGLAVSVTLC